MIHLLIRNLAQALCKKARGDLLYSENIALVDCPHCLRRYLKG